MGRPAHNKNTRWPRCVYFVADCARTVVKIGTAERIQSRLRDLTQMSPVPIELLGTIEGGTQVERWCHLQVARSRSHGEWFHWASPVIEFVTLVIAHGPNAASRLCPRELVDDKAAANVAYAGHGAIGPLPSRKVIAAALVETSKGAAIQVCDPLDSFVRAHPNATAIGAVCRCEGCRRYVSAVSQ